MHVFSISKFRFERRQSRPKLVGFLYSFLVDINENFEIRTVIARSRNVRQLFNFNFEINKLFWSNVIVYTARAHSLSRRFSKQKSFTAGVTFKSPPQSPLARPNPRVTYACYADYFHSKIEMLYRKYLEKLVHKN